MKPPVGARHFGAGLAAFLAVAAAASPTSTLPGVEPVVRDAPKRWAPVTSLPVIATGDAPAQRVRHVVHLAPDGLAYQRSRRRVYPSEAAFIAARREAAKTPPALLNALLRDRAGRADRGRT